MILRTSSDSLPRVASRRHGRRVNTWRPAKSWTKSPSPCEHLRFYASSLDSPAAILSPDAWTMRVSWARNVMVQLLCAFSLARVARGRCEAHRRHVRTSRPAHTARRACSRIRQPAGRARSCSGRSGSRAHVPGRCPRSGTGVGGDCQVDCTAFAAPTRGCAARTSVSIPVCSVNRQVVSRMLAAALLVEFLPASDLAGAGRADSRSCRSGQTPGACSLSEQSSTPHSVTSRCSVGPIFWRMP